MYTHIYIYIYIYIYYFLFADTGIYATGGLQPFTKSYARLLSLAPPLPPLWRRLRHSPSATPRVAAPTKNIAKSMLAGNRTVFKLACG